MYTYGITGGIGSGKSVVADILIASGIPVYDCDHRAKELYNTDVMLREAMIKLFGDEIYTVDGVLDRVRLSKLVFSDKELLAKVSALVHPVVRRDIDTWRSQIADLGYERCAIESAILLNSEELRAKVDSVITVTAPLETRIERAMRRDGADRSAIEARIRQQLPEEDMIRLSDYTVFNNGTTPILPQLQQIFA